MRKIQSCNIESGTYQLAYDAHLLGLDPNDEQYYACDQLAPGGENYVLWCDPRADRALHDALTTYSLPQRRHDYAIVQEQMAKDVPIIALWEVERVDAFGTSLKNFDPSPAGPTFWNVWAWRL